MYQFTRQDDEDSQASRQRRNAAARELEGAHLETSGRSTVISRWIFGSIELKSEVN